MDNSFIFTLFEGLDRKAPGSDTCTNRMFDILAPPQRAEILDIGCGAGSQALALARRCRNCHITAVDIHQPYLDALRKRADEEGTAERIVTVCTSMDDIPFAPEEFDVIWAEGSIFVIGFEKGLSYWKEFLKTGGSLALTEMVWFTDKPPEEIAAFMEEAYPVITTIAGCEQMIEKSGYDLVGSFSLPSEVWWREYYDPLQIKLTGMEKEYAENQDARTVIDMTWMEIEQFRKYSDYYGYQAFLLKKR